MRRFIAILILACLFINAKLHAQNYALYNSYCINPFYYNPAEAATPYTYVNFNHRKQWLGIEGAPTITTATITTLIDGTRTGIGFKASSFTRGLLRTNDFDASYVHSIPTNKKNMLYLALTAGAISNELDLNDINDDDPALMHYMENNIQPTAKFGMLYRTTSGINLGLALPQLFSPAITETSNFNYQHFSPLDQAIISAYYKRIVKGRIVSRTKRGVRTRVKTDAAVAPLELYAVYRYSRFGLSQPEGTVKLNLSPNFWLGTTYRYNYGFAGLAGFGIKNFSFSYSYEGRNMPESYFSEGTHEINCSIRFGKEKQVRQITPSLRSKLNAVSTVQQHSARFQQSEEDYTTVARKKYYVVIKTVSDFTFADQFKQKLIQQKFNADVVYDPILKKFHIHVFESQNASEAFEEARNLKNYTKLTSARVLVIDITKSKQR